MPFLLMQAFGVGALEEEDEDIYAVDSLSNYDQTMEINDDQHFGWTAPGSRKNIGSVFLLFMLSSAHITSYTGIRYFALNSTHITSYGIVCIWMSKQSV